MSGSETACKGCGREVTLLGNGYCGFCQPDEVDGYLEKIEGTWKDDDPEVLVFERPDVQPVVADVDGDLRLLSSGLLYPRQITREALIDAINEHGRPRVDALSNHFGRFDKGDFEDLYEDNEEASR